MSFQPQETDIFGGELPEDFPELRYLCRAIELGGEGESQLLVGPLPGHEGSYYAVRKAVSFDDDTGDIQILGTHLEEAGKKFLPALERLNPHWRALEVVYVAPHLEAEVLSTGKQVLGMEDAPLLCTAVYRRCPWWPDGSHQDAYWLEGNLDQVRELLGRVMPDHQEQLQQKAHLPYAVLVSADGTQRYAMPRPDEEPDAAWPPEQFERLGPAEVPDVCQVPEAVVPVLVTEPAIEHYRRLKQQEQNLPTALEEMAQMTWPLMVMRHEDEEKTSYVIYFVHGQGMEEPYWEVTGEDNDEEAVRLSILLRNAYRFGLVQGQKYGECSFLSYAAQAVRNSNRMGLA